MTTLIDGILIAMAILAVPLLENIVYERRRRRNIEALDQLAQSGYFVDDDEYRRHLIDIYLS